MTVRLRKDCEGILQCCCTVYFLLVCNTFWCNVDFNWGGGSWTSKPDLSVPMPLIMHFLNTSEEFFGKIYEFCCCSFYVGLYNDKYKATIQISGDNIIFNNSDFWSVRNYCEFIFNSKYLMRSDIIIIIFVILKTRITRTL